MIKHECFNGSDTGLIDMTLLRAYLEATKHKIESLALNRWNLTGMLDAHEWDDSRDSRVQRLRLHLGKWEPLIVVKAPDVGHYVIDGWHRLYMLYHDNPERDVIPFRAYAVDMSLIEMFRPPEYAVHREIKPGEIF